MTRRIIKSQMKKKKKKKKKKKIDMKRPKHDFMASLKDCTKQKNLCKGAKLHGEMLKRGLLKRCVYLANALISMYVKCGALERAKKVLEEIPSRNVVSWSALIWGYIQQGQSHDALNCFDLMQCEGILPDATTFTCILKACGNIRDLGKGEKIHNEIASKGLIERDVVLSTALVDMYSKCGALEKAQQALDGIPSRDVVSWSTIIAGYARAQRGHEALKCFERMQNEYIYPNAITFICVLKACGSIGAIDKGKQIHEMIASTGLLKKDIVLGNALVDMYAKCGVLEKAQQVLEELPLRNVVSWNVLITGYAQQGQCLQALNCFQQMQSDGFSPDVVTLICILKACGTSGSIEKGEELHNEIRFRSLLDNNTQLGNALVDMYAKCGVLGKARQVLEDIPIRDIVSWNALITGYVEHEHCVEALNFFEQMQREGIIPDAITFTCILKACGTLGMIEKGEAIHQEIVSRNLLKNEVVLGNSLVDMYVKCAAMEIAQKVLENLPDRNVVTWSTLIAGYAQNVQFHEALNCFERMQSEGFSPNIVTLTCVLKACGSIRAIDQGMKIHNVVSNRGLLKREIVFGSALVHMYTKCGELAKAQETLKELSIQNVVAWNALITGYTLKGQGREALSCFDQMQREGFSPNVVTFICILRTCGNIGAIDKGKEIHKDIASRSLLENDGMLRNALVDMYAKCGLLAKAQQMLDEIPIRTVVSWNALIKGYSQLGKCEETLNCLEEMLIEGLFPDEVTFLLVLGACSHLGLLNETQILYESMTKRYGIASGLEHDTCMVMVYGYAGFFDEAMSMIKVMPSINFPVVWRSLLEASRKFGNINLGTLAFNQLLQLDSTCAAPYALTANTFAVARMQKDAERIGAAMRY